MATRSEATCSFQTPGRRKKKAGNQALWVLRNLVRKTWPKEKADQHVFADYVGKSFATYKAYEHGVRELGRTEAIKLAQLFGVKADSLLGHDAKMKNARPMDLNGKELTVEWLRQWRGQESRDVSKMVGVAVEADADQHIARAEALIRAVLESYGNKSRQLLRTAQANEVFGGVVTQLEQQLDATAKAYNIRDKWMRRVNAIKVPASLETRCAELESGRAHAVAAEEAALKLLAECETRLALVPKEAAGLRDDLRQQSSNGGPTRHRAKGPR